MLNDTFSVIFKHCGYLVHATYVVNPFVWKVLRRNSCSKKVQLHYLRPWQHLLCVTICRTFSVQGIRIWKASLMLDLKETRKKSRSFPYYAALLEFTERSRAPGSNPGLVDIKSFPQLFPLDYDDKRNARNYTFILGSSRIVTSAFSSDFHLPDLMVINFPLLEEGKQGVMLFFLILTCFKKAAAPFYVWMCLKVINLCQERYNWSH